MFGLLSINYFSHRGPSDLKMFSCVNILFSSNTLSYKDCAIQVKFFLHPTEISTIQASQQYTYTVPTSTLALYSVQLDPQSVCGETSVSTVLFPSLSFSSLRPAYIFNICVLCC